MPIRIVLVDDHAILRDGLRLRLQREPNLAVVDEAGNATEAYARIEKSKPDIVIMDLDLPGADGLAATREIAQRWPNLKVLILTGRNEPVEIETVLKSGAAGFIRKEDASNELVRAIEVVSAGKIYLSTDATSLLAEVVKRKEQSASSGEGALTERELAVLKGISAGLSYKEIAHELGIGVKSVETYRARLARKLGLTSRAELVRYAVRERLVEP
jgi:DNA-binding NarL/FixJ family response regulator